MTKRKKNEEERLANLFYDYKQSELFERSNTFEQIENECHRAMKIATRNYNEILVRFYRISNKFMPFFC
jgi:UDP-galactopyranose mutase